MRHTLTRAVLTAGVAGLLLSGCGSSSSQPGSGDDNGVKAKSVSDIETTVTSAMKSSKTFEVTGSGPLSQGLSGNLDMKVDISSSPPKASFDVTTTNGGTMSVVVVNGHDFVTFNAAMAQQFGGSSDPAAAQLLAGKCIDYGSTSDSTNSIGSSFGAFANPNATNWFSDQNYTKGSVKTVNGTEVQTLMGANGSEYDIATHGSPLPVVITTKDSTTGASTPLTVKNWGSSFDISQPSGCVTMQDLQQSLGGGTPPTPTP